MDSSQVPGRLANRFADWDQFLDSPDGGGSFDTSPIFDPEHGFGGNGRMLMKNESLPGAPPFASITIADLEKWIPGFEAPIFGLNGGGCVSNGPFKDMKVSIGPMGQMTTNNTRCLTRNFFPTMAHMAASKQSYSAVLKAEDFTMFRRVMETGDLRFNGLSSHGGLNVTMHGALHNIGHGGIGGEVCFGMPRTNPAAIAKLSYSDGRRLQQRQRSAVLPPPCQS
jgi:tyrosinase